MKSASSKTVLASAEQSAELFSRLSLVTFAVALLVRLLHVWQIRPAPFFDLLIGDAHGYDEWAQRIAHGEWIGREVFYQAPLYPYFLGLIYAIAGHHLLIVRLVQAVVGATACALLGLAARRWFSEREGMIAGLALALYAPAIFFDGLIQKSVLDVFFICLMLWIAAGISRSGSRPRSWLALGLTTGGLALTRENALVFIAVILAWAVMGWWRSVPAPANPSKPKKGEGRTTPGQTLDAQTMAGPACAATFVFGLALVLLPVAVRNYAVSGGFYLTTSQFGPNFYIGNNPHADGMYRSLRPGRGAPEFERQDATELAEQASGRALTPAEVSSFWTGRAVSFITSNPAGWLKLLGRKCLLLVNADEMIDTESQETYTEWSWPLRIGGWIGHFGVLVPLALFGALARWPERRRLFLLYAMTTTYAVSLLLFYVFARYRYPLVPLLILFACGGIAAWRRILRAPRHRQIGAAAALLLAAVAANWPVVHAGYPEAVTEDNLGRALQADGRLEDAVAHFQRAIAFRADYSPAYNHIGLIQRARGKSDDAIKSFEQAIAVAPGYADSYFNLGFEWQARGDHERAIAQFREFIRLTPDEANVVPANNLLGLSLAASGKIEEAVRAFRMSLAREPRDVDALSGLADTLLTGHRFDEAARTYRAYVELVPGSGNAFHNLGLALVRQRKEGEAIDPFTRAATLQPANPAFHEDLGNALGSVGRLVDAERAYRRALELAPANVHIRNSLALALAAQGRRQDALAEFRRSLALEPNNAQTRIDLAAAIGK